MGCKWSLVLAATVAVVGMAAFLTIRVAPEPAYEGKPISEWMRDYNNKAFPSMVANRPVDIAIRHFGTNAFPLIAQRLKARDWPGREQSILFLRNRLKLPLSLITQRESQMQALGALSALRKEGKPLIPAVAESFDSMKGPLPALFAWWLESFGRDADSAIPVLIRKLKDNKTSSRSLLVEVVARTGWRQKETVLPTLKDCLLDSDPSVRAAAKTELAKQPWPWATGRALGANSGLMY
jgi:hypothetical protein